MHSEFKSATQIYVNPKFLQLFMTKRNRKNCPKFFHMIFFAFWIQICNLNLCKYHTFWNTNVEMIFFRIPGPGDQNRWNRKNWFFHRVIFAFWIQICNPNLCKSHMTKIAYPFWPDDQNRWNRKNCPKFFHRVIFAFWIQICNQNLCKSHIFWSTANIQKWPKFVKSENLPEILL